MHATKEGREFSLFIKNKNLFFTESYKTPIRFIGIRESNSFDENQNLSNSSVVLLTFANDSYFLNVFQRDDAAEEEEEKGEQPQSDIVFE